MPAPISVIIPARDASAALPLCLESLMPGLEAGLIREVIVIDEGSEDATARIAEATGAQVITPEGDAARQLSAGVSVARGAWLLILPAQTALSREWAERAGDHIDERPGKAAWFELKYRSDDPRARSVERKINRQALATGRPRPEQGLLLPKRLYDEVSGQRPPDPASLAGAIGKARLIMLNAQARVSAGLLETGAGRSGSLWRNLLGGRKTDE